MEIDAEFIVRRRNPISIYQRCTSGRHCESVLFQLHAKLKQNSSNRTTIGKLKV